MHMHTCTRHGGHGRRVACSAAAAHQLWVRGGPLARQHHRAGDAWGRGGDEGRVGQGGCSESEGSTTCCSLLTTYYTARAHRGGRTGPIALGRHGDWGPLQPA
eukprot:scaffold56777_cov64-Phaeocystis_antarctica.AAC.3